MVVANIVETIPVTSSLSFTYRPQRCTHILVITVQNILRYKVNMNTSSTFHSQSLAPFVTPSKDDYSLIGHDFSFLDEFDTSVDLCNPMDGNPMDDYPTRKRFHQDNEDTTTTNLQKQLDETRRQLEEMTNDRNQCVQLNQHLAQQLGQARYELDQERTMRDSHVRHALVQAKAQHDQAVDSFLHYTLPKGASIFPSRLSVDSDGITRNYMIGATIGTGSFGVVVRASHVRTKRRCAIKIVDSANADVSREVQVMLRLRHANVVRLYEYVVDVDKDKIGLVMEEGVMDLQMYIEQGNIMNLAALREVTLAILKALEYIHSQGVCHLDVKPENVLLVKKRIRQQHVKLCDFGLCSVSKEGATTVSEVNMKGTPDYFAPEMADFIPFSANAADMWSFGCLLLDLTGEMSQSWKRSYQMYNDPEDVGRYGFRSGIVRILRQFQEEDYFRRNPGFAPAFDLMKGVLKMKPQDRFTATRALQHAWLQE